jgi:hypothetical protein
MVALHIVAIWLLLDALIVVGGAVGLAIAAPDPSMRSAGGFCVG